MKKYTDLDDSPLSNGECVVYDSKRDTMWIPSSVGSNPRDETVDFLYIDAKTGDILNNISANSWPLPNCNYDATLDKIIGIELNGQNSEGNFEYILKQADPETLEITSDFSNSLDDGWCDYTDLFTYDTTNSIQYQVIYKNPSGSCSKYNGTGVLNGYLVGVDASTGDLKTSPMLCKNQNECPEDIQYWDGQ